MAGTTTLMRARAADGRPARMHLPGNVAGHKVLLLVTTCPKCSRLIVRQGVGLLVKIDTSSKKVRHQVVIRADLRDPPPGRLKLEVSTGRVVIDGLAVY